MQVSLKWREMRNVEVSSQQMKLKSAFDLGKTLSSNPELQSHWARYLCVLVSGFIENSVRLMYSDYVRSRAAPEVCKYAERHLGLFRNPNMESILQLTGSFSNQWREELVQRTQGQIQDSVNSIVNNRHNIAHGRSVGVTLGTMLGWYENALQLVGIIAEQCER